MENFMKHMKETLGESLDSPSSTIQLNDKEGKRIAKALKAEYLGFKDSIHAYWFNDKKYGSSYVGKNYDEALENRNKLWNRFKKD